METTKPRYRIYFSEGYEYWKFYIDDLHEPQDIGFPIVLRRIVNTVFTWPPYVGFDYSPL